MGIKGLGNLKPDEPPAKSTLGILVLFDKNNKATHHPLMCDLSGRPILPELGHQLHVGTVNYKVTDVVWDFNKNHIYVSALYSHDD